MNYSLNVKSSSIVHTLLSNCVKLLGKVQKLLIKCISYSVISKRIRVVSPKFYTARKNFTGPPVPTVPTNFKSVQEFLTPPYCCCCSVKKRSDSGIAEALKALKMHFLDPSQ